MTEANFFRVWVSVLAAVLAACLLAAASSADAQTTGTLSGKKIVLDPGHGGNDTGAVNGTLLEKDQNLDVAYRLKALLESSGVTVYMTRGGDPSNPAGGPRIKDPGDDAFADDATLSNNDRYTYANSTRANILVSIHMNASSNPSEDYTTTVFGKWRKDKELAQAVFGGLSTLPAASGTGTIKTRAPYSYASGVLLKSNMPATIAETVFITNTNEAALLSNGTRQQQIAEALRIGIENYLSTH